MTRRAVGAFESQLDDQTCRSDLRHRHQLPDRSVPSVPQRSPTRLRMPISTISSKQSSIRPVAPALGCRPGFANCGIKLQPPNAPSSRSKTRTIWSMPAAERSMSSSSPSSIVNSCWRGRRPRRRSAKFDRVQAVLLSNSPEATRYSDRRRYAQERGHHQAALAIS